MLPFLCPSITTTDPQEIGGDMDYPETPNPNYNSARFNESFDPLSAEFQLSDYLVLDEVFDEQDSSSQSMISSEQFASGSSTGYGGATSRNNRMQVIRPLLD